MVVVKKILFILIVFIMCFSFCEAKHIGKKQVDNAEFVIIKDKLTDKVFKKSKLSINEVFDWIDLAKQTQKKCGLKLKGVNSKNLVDKINEAIIKCDI